MSAYVVAQVHFKCARPRGSKTFEIIGPSADAALRKAARFNKRAPGIPKYIATECRPAGVTLVQRGAASRTRQLDPVFQGARLVRKRRRRRRAR